MSRLFTYPDKNAKLAVPLFVIRALAYAPDNTSVADPLTVSLELPSIVTSLLADRHMMYTDLPELLTTAGKLTVIAPLDESHNKNRVVS